MDIIEIRDLRLRCIIGFSLHERKDKQDVVINLRLGCDMRLAGETDNPNDAFNYRTIAKSIIRHVESSEYYLVEKLAAEIARLCVVNHGAPYAWVQVHKPGALRFSDSVGVVIERTPQDYQQQIVYVSLGSNIAPEQNLSKAITLLRRYTTVLKLSSVYRTSPQGDTNQADFLNMAAKISTHRTPEVFKRDVLDRIESELGRQRDPSNKNAPRTIDLDISLWGNAIFDYGEKPWHVPDGDIVRFAHVAIPLAEIAPDFLHPVEDKTLSEIAAGFSHIAMSRVDGLFTEE